MPLASIAITPRARWAALWSIYLREIVEEAYPLDMGIEVDVSLRRLIDRSEHARHRDVDRIRVAVELAEKRCATS